MPSYDFAIDRFNAIINTRLRLDACTLNNYLFIIGRKQSPASILWFPHRDHLRIFFLITIMLRYCK